MNARNSNSRDHTRRRLRAWGAVSVLALLAFAVEVDGAPAPRDEKPLVPALHK